MSWKLNEMIEKTIKHLDLEFSKLQLWRANPALIEWLKVDAYGDMQPIKNVGTIGILDVQTLKIEPWDKSLLWAISKSISESGLGLNPNVWADGIMIKFPMMTEEKRKEIAKIAKKLAEEAKVWIRNARADSMKEVKKMEDDGEISEDDRKVRETDIQKEIDKANSSIEDKYKTKNDDIMKV